MEYALINLDHLLIAMPPGEEAAARDFYSGLLGLGEIPKPPSLAKRGGVWFQGPDIAIHLGVEREFRPARKAHPCFIVDDLGALRRALETSGHPVTPDAELPGVERFYTEDPFGNRLEFQQA